MLGFVVIISPWKSCQPRLFNEDKMAQQTPLYEQHTLCGARMVDFHGWMMPLHYGSQIDEHHAVRTDAGMFDVSHMTIVDLRGSRTREFLRHRH